MGTGAALAGHESSARRRRKRVSLRSRRDCRQPGWIRAQHAAVLSALAEAAPMTWLVGRCLSAGYTGAFAMPVRGPRSGFTRRLLCARQRAAQRSARRQTRPPVAVMAGDGGSMFTMPELVTAAELGLPLPIVIWENGGSSKSRTTWTVAIFPGSASRVSTPILSRLPGPATVTESTPPTRPLQSAFRAALTPTGQP